MSRMLLLFAVAAMLVLALGGAAFELARGRRPVLLARAA
jgi:hypothetical protein